MRHTKMAEWIKNVEKAMSRIMNNEVNTSTEFKRERYNFLTLCKDLEHAEDKTKMIDKEIKAVDAVFQQIEWLCFSMVFKKW